MVDPVGVSSVSLIAGVRDTEEATVPDDGSDETTDELVPDEELRSPNILVPDFVTPDWLRRWLHLVPRDLRLLHTKHRDELRRVTGFPWPDERPDLDQAYELVAEGLQYPFFFPIFISLMFGLRQNANRKRTFFERIYSTFYTSARRRPDLKPGRSPSSRNPFPADDLTQYLSDGGDREVVLAAVILHWGSNPGLAADARQLIPLLPEAEQYIRSLERYRTRSNFNRLAESAFASALGDMDDFLTEDDGDASDDGSATSGAPLTNSDDMAASPTLTSQTPADLAAVEADWAHDLERVIAIANTARLAPPDPTVADTLSAILERLRGYVSVYEALVPKSIAVAELVAYLTEAIASLTAIVDQIAGADEAAAFNEPFAMAFADLPQEVTPEAHAQATEKADETERSLAAARDSLEQEEQVQAGPLPRKQKNTESATLLDAAEQHARSGLESALAALMVLVTAAAMPAMAASPVQAPLADEPPPVPVVPEQPRPEEPETPEAFPSVEDEVVLEDEVLEGEMPDLEPLAPSPEAQEPDSSEHEDALVEPVAQKLLELFAAAEFGLAYHLRRAAEQTLPAETLLPFTAPELRVIAVAHRMLSAPRQEVDAFRAALEACLDVAQGIREPKNACDEARKIALLASAVPAAIFQAEETSSAMQVIETLGATGSSASFFNLIEALEDNRKMGFPLTPVNLRAVRDASSDIDVVDERLTDLRDQIKAMDAAKFRFALAEHVKSWLIGPHGAVGQLANALGSSSGTPAARTFAMAYKARDGAVELLDQATRQAGRVGQEVDGPPRERLLAFIMEIAGRCSEYADAAEQADGLRFQGGRLQVVRRIRDSLIAGIERVLRETDGATGNPLITAAYAQACEVLGHTRRVLEGATLFHDRLSATTALHVPLLWLSDLAWSGGWLPSPYDAQRLMGAIHRLELPRIPEAPDEAFEAAFAARRAEGAFVAAHMLLSVADRFGVPSERVEDLRAALLADQEVRKGQVRAKIEQAEQLLDKVRRMAIGGLDTATRLREDLAAVKPDRLPAELPDEVLPEVVEGDRILDFNSANARVDDVIRKARQLLDKGKAEFVERIHALDMAGRISASDKRDLESLVAADDIATLSDWVKMFEAEGHKRPLLGAQIVNHRLEAFLTRLKAIQAVDLQAAQAALAEGEDLGPFPLASLDSSRREEAAETLRRWIELKRFAKSGAANLSAAGAHIIDLLSRLTYQAKLIGPDAGLSAPKRGVFTIDVELKLPVDPTSLLLPDFGSHTGGGWRVVVSANIPSPSDICSRAAGAEPRGILVLVLGTMGVERRNQLKLECVRKNCKVLVVDEALLLHMLSDGEHNPLSLFEVAQGFTIATPYQDYGTTPVPPEMFKGRVRERAQILTPHGSYIVYGGRRLGKTALLRDIARAAVDHALFAYIDLRMSSASIWEKASIALREVFPQEPAKNPHDFEVGVQGWLAADQRRRILLMLDEADNFIREQATGEMPYRDFLQLMSLMTETNHRFKFVLAGLHNVSRIVRTENSPLAQISNDAVRIGPLLGEDVGDAEFLVRGPMAALGYEFAKREDVWRILSVTNYYPVLIQVFCQGLLRLIHEQMIRSGKPIRTIETALVNEALRNPEIRSGLYESFDKTITHIEQRYELLTYILAERALLEAGEGLDSEGLTAGEVTKRAQAYWPEAFPKGIDPTEVEYLLDEMEGFGLLRWTPTGRWVLRSRMLLELMVSDESELLERLYSFKGRWVEEQFDPKNSRRSLTRGGRARGDQTTSPLTEGQEAEIMHPLRDGHRVFVVFGPPVAGIDDVPVAITSSRSVHAQGDRKARVELVHERSKEDLLRALRKGSGDALRVVVVDPRTPWQPDWVADTLKISAVAHGQVRPVFIGRPAHAAAWAASALRSATNPKLKVIPLRPWARSYVATSLDALTLLRPGLVDRILEATGGWNELCHDLFRQVHATPGKIDRCIEDACAKAIGQTATLERLGITADLVSLFGALAQWAAEGALTTDYLQEICQSEGRDPLETTHYAHLMGLVSPGLALDGEGRNRPVEMNPLAVATLSHSKAAAE